MSTGRESPVCQPAMRCETRRFIRLKAPPRRETLTGTSLIQRREVVGCSDPGGEAHRFSLRVRLPSLVPSRDPTVANATGEIPVRSLRRRDCEHCRCASPGLLDTGYGAWQAEKGEQASVSESRYR